MKKTLKTIFTVICVLFGILLFISSFAFFDSDPGLFLVLAGVSWIFILAPYWQKRNKRKASASAFTSKKSNKKYKIPKGQTPETYGLSLSDQLHDAIETLNHSMNVETSPHEFTQLFLRFFDSYDELKRFNARYSKALSPKLQSLLAELESTSASLLCSAMNAYLEKRFNLIKSSPSQRNYEDVFEEFLLQVESDPNTSHLISKDAKSYWHTRIESIREGRDSAPSYYDPLYVVDHMDGHDFEQWCAELLRKSNYTNVSISGKAGDQGVDILAEKDGVKYAIQCKCYSSNLGNTPVQEVYAGKSMYDCQVGVVMTNQYFTDGAKALAAKTGVLLWDRDVIEGMIKLTATIH